MRLFYAKGTISIAAAIALREAGLHWDPVKVDFASAEQTKEPYLAINPKGRVPALEISPSEILTETGAILEYVGAIAPSAGLVPDDPAEAAHMRSVMYFLASTMHVNHAHARRGTRWADAASSHQDMAARVPGNMAQNAAYVQTHCLRGDYVLGDRFSIADPYLFMVCSWLEGDGVALTEYGQIAAYLDRMNARDSVIFVREEGML